MYMAYGWPQVMPIESGLCPTSLRIVYLKVLNRLLLVVSPSHLELWSSSQHKVRLGKYIRDLNSVQSEGENLQAIWSPDAKMIAVLTTSFTLHIFRVQISEKQLMLGGNQPSGLSLATINLVFSGRAPFFGKKLTVSNFVCDSRSICLGLSDGVLYVTSWKGEFSDTFKLHTHTVVAQDSHQLLQNGFSTPDGISQVSASSFRSSSDSAIVQLELSLLLRLLVVICSDGQVALCSLSKKGLKQPDSIKVEKWLSHCDAVCASIASEQQILAIGCRRGAVELYDLADSASLMRTVALYDWG